MAVAIRSTRGLLLRPPDIGKLAGRPLSGVLRYKAEAGLRAPHHSRRRRPLPRKGRFSGFVCTFYE